jgi:asparagine N-glycosylation enzyme membrane subunit Stt3
METKSRCDPTKLNLKKSVYLVLVVVLGSLVGLLISALVLLWSNLAYGAWVNVMFQVLILAGAISGTFVGPRWWQIIYVEHRRWRRRGDQK